MFPKENFSVKITDKRLLSPKRGTIKRSANGNNYNLRKTDSIIKIDVLPPVSFKEMVLGFVEGKVDLKSKTGDKFQIEIGLKSMIKGIYISFFIFFPFFVFLLAKKSLFGAILFLLLFCTIMIFQNRQLLGAIEILKERLERDEGIFKEN